MKLKIEIKMDNAAFGDCDQEAGFLIAILRDLAEHLEAAREPFPLGNHRVMIDCNGNRIGEARVTR